MVFDSDKASIYSERFSDGNIFFLKMSRLTPYRNWIDSREGIEKSSLNISTVFDAKR